MNNKKFVVNYHVGGDVIKDVVSYWDCKTRSNVAERLFKELNTNDAKLILINSWNKDKFKHDVIGIPSHKVDYFTIDGIDE